jgi:hypothetical protein
MKTYLRSALFSVALTSFFGCVAQQIQTRETGPFTSLEISGTVRVYYTHSDTLTLKVEARGDDLENVETKLENDVLRISNKGTDSEIKVYVSNNRLQKLGVSGSTEFRSENTIQAENFSFNVSGSSDVRGTIQAKEIQCTASGASNLVLEGNAEKLSVNVGGASTVKAYGLVVKQASAISAGAATAKIFATESVKASAAGASDIRIKGDPRDIDASSSGAASVTRVKGNDAEKQETNDTTEYNFKHKKVIVIKDKAKKKRSIERNSSNFEHWTGFSAAVNGYLSPQGSIGLPARQSFAELNYPRSFNLQFNIMEHGFKLARNYVRLVIGFGIDYHQYSFANKTRLDPDTNYTWGYIDSTQNYTYRKNRLRATYLQVPLLLEFNTSNRPSKTFHIAFGVVGQYLVGSRTKLLLEQDRNEIVLTRKDSYNLNPFMAKAHVNFGYRGWTIFAEYSLTPLFQADKGPELKPFAVGLRVIPFS